MIRSLCRPIGISAQALVLMVLLIAAFMVAFSGLFQANDFDSDIIRAGALATLRGDNPYRDTSRDGLSAYFNPPHSVYAYPLMLASGTVYVLTLVLVVALAVYVFETPWLALYVLTPAFLVHGVGANNLGLQVGVLGIVALWLAREREDGTGALLTAWAYGLLLVKPQMGLGIVALHVLWLLWQGKVRFLLMTLALCAAWFLVLPSLVSLAMGGRLPWLDWWQDVVANRLFQAVPDARINPQTDMEPFRNKWGAPGALLLTAISLSVWWARRHD